MRTAYEGYFPPHFRGYIHARGRTLRDVIMSEWGDIYDGGPPADVLDGIVTGELPTDVGTVYLIVDTPRGPWLVTHPCYPGRLREECGRLCMGILPD